MNTPGLQRAVFLLLLAIVTVALAWVLSPFFGAVFWAVIMALLFRSTFRALLGRLGGRRNLAALLTLLLIVLMVVLPMVLLSAAVANEITTLVARVRAGDVNYRAYAQQVLAALPHWLTEQMAQFDLIDIQSVVEKFSDALLKSGQAVTSRALSIGQNALVFMVNLTIMLYLLFFFLRDGEHLSRMLRQAIPMERAQTHYLANKFATVVRATVRGNVVVALAQGVLGGLAFWALDIRGAVLWGSVMALLSLLPAVGAALIWAPVAIYLLATGSIWQGVALIVWGALAVGMVDNLLRPILVGKDTKLPDYVVLLTTLGGISLFGISGFVIGPTIAALFVAAWALFSREEEDAVSQDAPPPHS
ncbi:MAG: AI-2E family transporter [Burkholderiaceae bacterium]|jgi:predicted PurR-regulated permease PerM|nr:AI-2E family transporter [Burkholderiaceae bacterium]